MSGLKKEMLTDDEKLDLEEPILNESNQRLTVFPIQYPKIWESYKKQQEAFWKAEEIDFSQDEYEFNKLGEDEQRVIKYILAFFAASDGIVNWNLRERFLNDVKVMEIQTAYTYQMMMESIHGETYSLMLENIIKDPKEKEFLFNAVSTVESVKEMAEWAIKWIDSPKRFAYRVVAFTVVEGVFFSGAFALIFWLKNFRKEGGKSFMNGLVKSNEFIARDEGMHTNFGCDVYALLKHKLTMEEVYEMMDEGVKISKKFTTDAIKCQLIGMSPDLMSEYIEFIADRLLVSLGYSKKYNKSNPFPFMETIGMIKKTNFFESRPTDYAQAYNKDNMAKSELTLLDDF